MKPKVAPPDFLIGMPLGAVPGAQPKVLVREEEGIFVSNPSEQDVRARSAMLSDLVEQLVAYRARKRIENPAWSRAQLGERIAHAIRKKAFGWSLSPAEAEGVLRSLDAIPVDSDPDEQ